MRTSGLPPPRRVPVLQTPLDVLDGPSEPSQTATRRPIASRSRLLHTTASVGTSLDEVSSLSNQQLPPSNRIRDAPGGVVQSSQRTIRRPVAALSRLLRTTETTSTSTACAVPDTDRVASSSDSTSATVASVEIADPQPEPAQSMAAPTLPPVSRSRTQPVSQSPSAIVARVPQPEPAQSMAASSLPSVSRSRPQPISQSRPKPRAVYRNSVLYDNVCVLSLLSISLPDNLLLV